MNKRQAKIEALWTAVGILDATDGMAFSHLKDQSEMDKVQSALAKIADELRRRAERLEAA